MNTFIKGSAVESTKEFEVLHQGRKYWVGRDCFGIVEIGNVFDNEPLVHVRWDQMRDVVLPVDSNMLRDAQPAVPAKPDMVNHPPHYTSSPAKCSKCGHQIECIDVVQHMGFSIGNAVKYLWRAGLKNDAIEDLKKSVWHINAEIAKREKGE